MDYNKDTKNTMLSIQKMHSGIEAFSITLLKRCERLTTAVYLVTGFLSDNEPLKYRLRTLSIDLVREASLLKNGNQGIGSNVLEEIRTNITEILSLLELAFISGLVSEMNFTILKREYVSLRDTIEIRKASRESSTDSILGDNFFAQVISKENRDETEQQKPFSKGHSIGHNNNQASDRNDKGQKAIRHEQQKEFIKDKQTSYSFESNIRNVHTNTDVAKESRRARILKLVKDNREVTIKDIATHFADLSEKTIQRELVSLVEAGMLKKFGERRWSRYALK